MRTIPAPVMITAAGLDQALSESREQPASGNRSAAEGGSPQSDAGPYATERLQATRVALGILTGLTLSAFGAVIVGVVTALRMNGLLP